jgi:beta-mannosidase
VNHVTSAAELSGPWQVSQLPDGTAATEHAHSSVASWLPATVPGAIQYDLVAADRLRNPYEGSEAATEAHWVSAADWIYSTTFDADPASASRWVLEFDGVDTFADVWLNGRQLGSTANAYRVNRFPVADCDLRALGNELVVHVKGHASMIMDKVPEARRRLGHTDQVEGKLGKSLIRRYQRSFFSGNSSLLNVGTGVLGIGIHRPVRLVGLAAAEVTDVFVRTITVGESATLEAAITVEAAAEADQVELRLLSPGTTTVAAAASGTVDASGHAKLELQLLDPQVWWPRGYGDQPLYTAEVNLRRDGEVLTSVTQPVGIRTVELLENKPSGRPTFELVVNGLPVHVRGTNWIPMDYLKVHGEKQDYERVFALLDSGNNNLVRMWGGGAIESPDFYAECDRLGIMVWQDFYLHSNTYPDYDPEFVAEFREECREALVLMRRHPSLVMLCGGNEQREGWDEWQWKDQIDQFYGERLVTETVPALVDELQPGVPYVDNSPHGGAWSQSPVHGEGHIWGNFFNSTKDPLFVTETCWGQESYSKPETLMEVMDLDVDKFTGLGWPARWTARTGLPLFTKFPYTGYHNTGGLRQYLRGLEIEQAMADHHALANFRLRSPSCHGIVYWSFNKGGPLFQFGAVDYRLRPLMSHYMVGRLYRDLVVGIYRDVDDIRVVASNLSRQAVNAMLDVRHLDTAGKVINRWVEEVRVQPGAPVRMLSLDGYYGKVVDRNREVIFARISVDGKALSDDMLLLGPLVELVTPNAGVFGAAKRVGDDEWELELSTDGVSKMVQIEGTDGLILSDNYFALATGLPRTVNIKALERKRSAETVVLSVSSLDGEGAVEVPLT